MSEQYEEVLRRLDALRPSEEVDAIEIDDLQRFFLSLDDFDRLARELAASQREP